MSLIHVVRVGAHDQLKGSFCRPLACAERLHELFVEFASFGASKARWVSWFRCLTMCCR